MGLRGRYPAGLLRLRLGRRAAKVTATGLAGPPVLEPIGEHAQGDGLGRASQPTLLRFENGVRRADLLRPGNVNASQGVLGIPAALVCVSAVLAAAGRAARGCTRVIMLSEP